MRTLVRNENRFVVSNNNLCDPSIKAQSRAQSRKIFNI